MHGNYVNLEYNMFKLRTTSTVPIHLYQFCITVCQTLRKQ